VEFKGEIGVDYGGVKRELFTLAGKELVTSTPLLAPCSNGRFMWFATQHRSRTGPGYATSVPGTPSSAEHARKQVRLGEAFVFPSTTADGASAAPHVPAHSLAFYLGLVVGLGTYNGVHVNLPLPQCVYKTIKGEQVGSCFNKGGALEHLPVLVCPPCLRF
jgi:hypothetical protein